MSELPEGWKRRPLSALGELRLGKMLDKAKNKGEPAQYLRNVNVRWFEFDLSDLQDIRVDEEERTTLSVRDGDLMICEGGEPGRCAVWRSGPNSLVYQKALHRFRSNGSIDPRFLMYQLKQLAVSGKLQEAFTGTTIKHLTRESLARLEVLVGPLAEQKRIADKLDRLLAAVDTCKARLDAIPDILKRFRQSVLAAAVSGELTEEWRKHNGPVGERLSEFPTVPFVELLQEPLRNGRSVRDGGGAKVLRLTSLKGDFIDLSESKSGQWTVDEARPFFVRAGDFLISRGNGSLNLVGRGCLVRNDPGEIAFPDTLIRARLNQERVVPSFLRLVWSSEPIRRQIERAAKTTAGIWKVNQPSLEAVRLPLPSMHEQQEIVRRVELLLARATGIATRVGKAHGSLRQATQSALAKAFRRDFEHGMSRLVTCSCGGRSHEFRAEQGENEARQPEYEATGVRA